MNISRTDIFNQALQKLGLDPISDADEDSTKANLCRRYYETSIEQIIRKFPFNCCITRAELAQVSDYPTNSQFKCAYQLPADYIKAIEVNDQEVYVREGNYLLCNAGKCVLRYARQLPNTSYLDPALAECVILMLTSKISFPLTNDINLAGSFLQLLKQSVLPEAIVSDNQEININRKNYGLFGESDAPYQIVNGIYGW